MKLPFKKKQQNTPSNGQTPESEKTISSLGNKFTARKNEDDITNLSLMDQLYPKKAPEPTPETPAETAPPKEINPYDMVLKAKPPTLKQQINTIPKKIAEKSSTIDKKALSLIMAFLTVGTIIAVVTVLFWLFNSFQFQTGPATDSNLIVKPKK